MNEDAEGTPSADAMERAPRSVLLGLGLGAAMAVAVLGVVYAMVAIPVYALAQIGSRGVDREFVREALLTWGLGFAVVVGVVCGVVIGIWYQRGGRLPTDRTPF